MDKITAERRSANMRAVRAKDMKPELLVRQLTHRLGYRFRLHRKDLPGKPDLVFPVRKAVILVHGCFWHQHRKPNCADGRQPRSNTQYWLPKLANNRTRDVQNLGRLKRLGWKVLVVWECELKDRRTLSSRIDKFLRSASS